MIKLVIFLSIFILHNCDDSKTAEQEKEPEVIVITDPAITTLPLKTWPVPLSTALTTNRYLYKADVQGFPDYRFVISRKEYTTGYIRYYYLDNYNKPPNDRETRITASVYHNSIASFVGTDGRKAIWKYYPYYNIFPDVRTAEMEEWHSRVPGSIEDIIINPEGGYFVAFNATYQGSDPAGDGLVYKVASVDHSGGGPVVIKGGKVYKLLLYDGQVIAFGNVNNQIFFRKFSSTPQYSWTIQNSILYTLPYDMQVMGVQHRGDYLLIRCAYNFNTIKLIEILNPYL